MEENVLEDQGGNGGRAWRLSVPFHDFLKMQAWVFTVTIFLDLKEYFQLKGNNRKLKRCYLFSLPKLQLHSRTWSFTRFWGGLQFTNNFFLRPASQLPQRVITTPLFHESILKTTSDMRIFTRSNFLKVQNLRGRAITQFESSRIPGTGFNFMAASN